MNQLDEIICSFDRGLRTLTGGHQAVRDYPGANFSEAPLSEEERAHIVGLMRVNHTGEVCAQALYEGQALTAKGEDAKSALLAAAGEEQDHLVWCEQRLSELEGGPSALAPVFFGLSCALDVPAVFEAIDIHFILRGKGLNPQRVDRAVSLSAEKYCSASIMLARAGVQISHSYEIFDATEA